MTAAHEKLLLTLANAAVLPSTFIVVAGIVSGHASPPPAWLEQGMDRWLPLMPWTVWLYVSWYPAPILLLFLPPSAFRRAYSAEVLAFALCSAFYLMWPWTAPRPSLPSAHDLTGRLLGTLYDIDPPVNVFPSFHAAVAAVIVLSVRPHRRQYRWLLALWMAAICAACVLTKQHFLLDVPAGLLTGTLAVGICRCVPVRRTTASSYGWRVGHSAESRDGGASAGCRSTTTCW